MLIRSLLLTASLVALFGPPSIKVEPVSADRTAAVPGAVFMLTGRHHGDSTGFTVTGRAEGTVDGKRITRRLTLTPTRQSGVYGVLSQWEKGTPWVLVFTVSEGGHDQYGIAEAMVKIAADGKVAGIDYPLGKLPEGTPWPRKVESREIDAALVAMAAKRP